MTGKHSSPLLYFGGKPVKAGLIRISLVLLLIVLSLPFIILAYTSLPINSYLGQVKARPAIEVHSVDDLQAQLKANNLWDVPESPEIPAFVVKRLPSDLPHLEAPEQKRVFLHALLPATVVALAEVREERAALEEIVCKFPPNLPPVSFATLAGARSPVGSLSRREVDFLRNICLKYRTDELAELRRRINPVPISLIMAQSALESSWGGSRMALQRNNIFGIMSADREVALPGKEDENKVYSGVIYSSLLDSVRAYLLMLNRGQAYARFRDLREKTLNPLTLATGLQKYSERGHEYTADLSKLIRTNDLQVYDRYVLAESDIPRGRLRLAGLDPRF